MIPAASQRFYRQLLGRPPLRSCSLMPSVPNDVAPSVPLSTYERLAASSPAERTELVLQLIQSHPQGRLELPVRDGHQAILNDVALGQATLRERLWPGQE